MVPLPEGDQICPVCGTQMVLIGEEYVRRECLAQGDRGVLTVDAAQRAAGEEDGAAAVLAGDRRLLPEVQRRPGHEHLARSSANPALPRRPIGPAPPGA